MDHAEKLSYIFFGGMAAAFVVFWLLGAFRNT